MQLQSGGVSAPNVQVGLSELWAANEIEIVHHEQNRAKGHESRCQSSRGPYQLFAAHQEQAAHQFETLHMQNAMTDPSAPSTLELRKYSSKPLPGFS